MPPIVSGVCQRLIRVQLCDDGPRPYKVWQSASCTDPGKGNSKPVWGKFGIFLRPAFGEGKDLWKYIEVGRKFVRGGTTGPTVGVRV